MGDVIKFSDLTPSQQRALQTDGKVVVSAAAGSGKTTAMLVGIADKLRSGVSLKNMLILVYNEATATELKEKLRDELFLRACSCGGEEAEIYRRALDELPFSHIGTIHSFCQGLIRENFEKLEISPSFSVLDESGHAAYMARALDKVFTEYDDSGDEVFSAVSAVFAKSRNDDDFRSCLMRIFEHIDVQPDRTEFIDNVQNCYAEPYRNTFIDVLVASAKRAAATVLKEAQDLLPVLIGCKERAYADNCESIIRAEDTLLKTADTPSKAELDVLTALSATETWLKRAAKTRGGDTAEEIINRIKNCQGAAKELFLPFGVFYNAEEYQNIFGQNKQYVFKLLEVVLAFDKELSASKAADDVLSFSDLEHKAAQLIGLLAERGELESVARFDDVFVDEFQDVNPIEEYVISSLMRKNAFMVGDVKQSIYGFRLADPEPYRKRFEKAVAEGRGVSFNRNFRSHSQILEFVNGVFSAVMTKESADIDYEGEAAFEEEKTRVNGTVELHLFAAPRQDGSLSSGLYDITSDVPQEDGGDATEYEARFIASKIRELVGKAPSDDKGNLVTYGDIAILLRSRTAPASKIMSVLREEGIPVDDAAFNRDDTRPETEIINFLKVLDNPRQDIPLCGFLMSWFGGLDENDLNEIARCAQKTDECFYDAVLRRAQDSDEVGLKLTSVLQTLETYRLKASFLSVGELLSEIVGTYCYDARLMKSGEAVVNSLQGFVTSVIESGIVGVSAFLQRYQETNAAPDKKPSGGNRVHVSTYHGYKGLEIPVVFLPNVSAKKPTISYSGDVIMTGKGYIGLNGFDFEGKTKTKNTLSKTAVTTLIKEREHKEEMRLFYVALTRAKKYLYITGAGDAEKFNRLDDSPLYGAENSRLALLETARHRGYITINAVGHVDPSEYPKPEKREAPLLEINGGEYVDGTEYNVAEYNVAQDASIENYVGTENYAGEENRIDAVLTGAELSAEIIKERAGEREKTLRAILDGRKPYVHDEATSLAMKYSVSALETVNTDAVLPDDKDEGLTRRYEDKTDVGTLYHKVMENVDFCAEGRAGVMAELDRMVSEGILTQDEKQSVDADAIAAALSSDVMRLAAKSVCLREKSFMMYVPASEVVDGVSSKDKVLVQGVIDLVIRGEKTVLVDYKYSALRNAEARKKYKKQLNLYKMALEAAFSEKIDAAYVLSLKNGRTYSMEQLDGE